MERVSDIVIDIIRSYRELPDDFCDINEIMYTRKQLATYCVTLAVETGKCRKSWKLKEAVYESRKNQKRIEFEKMGTTKADWSARANVETEYNESVSFESEYWSLDYLLKSVREVLSEMNQRVSYLRKEEEDEKYFNKG